MIYELRIYTCKPGSVARVLDMWKTEGQAMIEPYMKMVGQWTGESGVTHQIYTLWEFEDFDHRLRAREALFRHPGFAEYLARVREHYIQQEAFFLLPTEISPLK